MPKALTPRPAATWTIDDLLEEAVDGIDLVDLAVGHVGHADTLPGPLAV